MVVTPRRAAAALAVLLVLFAGWALDRLIVTDSERVENVVREMIRCVENRDADGIFARVSPLYNDGYRDAAGLRIMAEAFFGYCDDISIRQRGISVKVSGARAAAAVSVFVDCGDGKLLGRSEWRLDFDRSPDGQWQLASLVPLRFGGRDADGWEGVGIGRER